MFKQPPIVAIVGKPNVGKSALFNRLIRRRKAIVSDESGVTRDLNYEMVFNENTCYKLADSAGFTNKGYGNDIHVYTREFNTKLIEEAAVIIFICEITGLDSEDFDIAEIVRKSGKPCVFVLNKADRKNAFENRFDFFELGLREEPLLISALHGTNIEELKKKIAEKLISFENGDASQKLNERGNGEGLRISVEEAFSKEDESRRHAEINISVAIVGQPNVGKSSLLNLLVNQKRALVTPEPGTTRDIVDEVIEYKEYKIKLVDTAGIKKRKRIKENIDFYSLLRTEKAIKNATVVILLIDALKGITTQDKKITSMVVSEKKGLIIAANKWDKAVENGIDPFEFKEEVYYSFPHIEFADLIKISAKTGYNKIKLLENILIVYTNYTRKIQTNELNTVTRKLVHHGVHVKYGFQKYTSPPLFEFFINKKDGNGENFKRYIANSIRKHFNFRGVPIEIRLRN
jgi:GTP-binding protein